MSTLAPYGTTHIPAVRRPLPGTKVTGAIFTLLGQEIAPSPIVLCPKAIGAVMPRPARLPG
jgi:hypothetical protein